MSSPADPNADFPAGSRVRVLPIGRAAKPARLRLVGRVGTVVHSSKTVVLVEFPGEKFREHFTPRQVERAEGRTG